MNSKVKRKQAYRRGKYAEYMAALFLILKGYYPLAWRKHLPYYEADLIMRKGSCFILVEVKYRKNLIDGLYAITPHKKKHLHRIALMMLKYYGKKSHQTPEIRIDAVIISRFRITHLKNII